MRKKSVYSHFILLLILCSAPYLFAQDTDRIQQHRMYFEQTDYKGYVTFETVRKGFTGALIGRKARAFITLYKSSSSPEAFKLAKLGSLPHEIEKFTIVVEGKANFPNGIGLGRHYGDVTLEIGNGSLSDYSHPNFSDNAKVYLKKIYNQQKKNIWEEDGRFQGAIKTILFLELKQKIDVAERILAREEADEKTALDFIQEGEKHMLNKSYALAITAFESAERYAKEHRTKLKAKSNLEWAERESKASSSKIPSKASSSTNTAKTEVQSWLSAFERNPEAAMITKQREEQQQKAYLRAQQRAKEKQELQNLLAYGRGYNPLNPNDPTTKRINELRNKEAKYTLEDFNDRQKEAERKRREQQLKTKLQNEERRQRELAAAEERRRRAEEIERSKPVETTEQRNARLLKEKAQREKAEVDRKQREHNLMLTNIANERKEKLNASSAEKKAYFKNVASKMPANAFFEGLAKIKYVDHWGFIDNSGKLVIPVIYSGVGNFVDGFATAYLEGKIGRVDLKGNFHLSEQNNFKALTGKFWGLKQGDKWILSTINKKPIGNLSVDDFASVHPNNFKGYFPVVKDKKLGYINTKGELCIPFEYEQASFVTASKIAVRKNGLWGMVDTQGKEIIPFLYDVFISDAENPLIIVRKKTGEENNLMGCIDHNGTLIIPFQYEDISISGRDIISVKLPNQNYWNCLDLKGNKAFEMTKRSAYEFKEGFSFNNDNWFINTKGNSLKKHPQITKGKSLFKDGLAVVENQDKKFGMINTKGELVIPFEYDYLDTPTNGLIHAELYGEKIYLDLTGNKVF